MATFHDILVPIDFGDAMDPAIDLALQIAKDGEANVTLVHAFDVQAFFAGGVMGPAFDLEPVQAELQRQLAALREKTRARWPRLEAVIRTGRIVEAILEEARVRGADLIVVGTHGRRGLAHALLGSEAEKIVRLSPVPVLTVRPRRSAV